MSTSKQDCITALERAANELGRSPSQSEYSGLDISPSARTIKRRFDSWNGAKEAADLDTWNKRGLPVNKTFFREIDTEEKAYWLGFLYGDGSAIQADSGSIKTQLQIGHRDIGHIRKYKQAIESGHKVNEFEDSDGNPKAGLAVQNSTFGDCLASHGFKPGKMTSTALPELGDEDLRIGFIRGLSDADGHYGRKQWTIVGSNQKRLERLSEWIPFDTYMQKRHRDKDRLGKDVLTLNGLDVLPDFYGWLFPDGEETTPVLDRKLPKVMKHSNNN